MHGRSEPEGERPRGDEPDRVEEWGVKRCLLPDQAETGAAQPAGCKQERLVPQAHKGHAGRRRCDGCGHADDGGLHEAW